MEVPSKDETLKKISSLANTFGGYMVVGARANSADGRLTELPGVDPESGYRQKVVQWCFAAGEICWNEAVSFHRRKWPCPRAS